MLEMKHYEACVVANRILSGGPVLCYKTCSFLMSEAGAYKCARIIDEISINGRNYELIYELSKEWREFDNAFI